MNARALLKNQNVKLDTHQRGDGQGMKWQDTHLHKTFTGNRYRGWEVTYPLFGNQKPSGRTRGRRLSAEEIYPITNEIEKALHSEQLRRGIAEDVAKTLSGYRNNDITVETAQMAARRFADYFGLKPDFIEAVGRFYGNNLARFTSTHADTISDARFVMDQNARHVRIRHEKSWL